MRIASVAGTEIDEKRNENRIALQAAGKPVIIDGRKKREYPKSFSHLYFLNRKRESCEKAKAKQADQ